MLLAVTGAGAPLRPIYHEKAATPDHVQLTRGDAPHISLKAIALEWEQRWSKGRPRSGQVPASREWAQRHTLRPYEIRRQGAKFLYPEWGAPGTLERN